MKKNTIIAISILLNIVLLAVVFVAPRKEVIDQSQYDIVIQAWLRNNQSNEDKMEKIEKDVERFKEGRITSSQLIERCYHTAMSTTAITY